MRQSVKDIVTRLLICMMLILGSAVGFAEGDPGGLDGGSGGGGLDNPGGPPPGGAVPVDGGLALLLVAGAGYGAKKAYDYRKGQKSKGKS